MTLLAFEAGDVGTVVHLYRDGTAYEIEFTTLAGKTAGVVTVEAAHVRAVSKREITHAGPWSNRPPQPCTKSRRSTAVAVPRTEDESRKW